MSPREIKDYAEQPKVLVPVSVLLTAGAVVLGGRVLPGDGEKEILTALNKTNASLAEAKTSNQLLAQKFDLFIQSWSGYPQRISNLELNGEKMSGRIERNNERIGRLENVIDRASSWPGEMGEAP